MFCASFQKYISSTKIFIVQNGIHNLILKSNYIRIGNKAENKMFGEKNRSGKITIIFGKIDHFKDRPFIIIFVSPEK